MIREQDQILESDSIDQEKLQEHVVDWQSDDSLINREKRVVANIALTGKESRNGYQYSDQALKNAVPLYENRPVFLDHADNALRPHERSTRDLVGSITNVRYEQGRIRGDIEVLETESGGTFLALAEKKNQFVGMSHVVMARRNSEKTIVEEIEEVISVDAVVYPATTNTFYEQQESKGNDSEGEAEPEESLLETEIKILKGKLAESRVCYEQLVEKYERLLNKTEVDQQIEKLIQESRFPQESLTKEFLEVLRELPDQNSRARLLQERQQFFHQWNKLKPCSETRHQTESQKPLDQRFIAAIKN